MRIIQLIMLGLILLGQAQPARASAFSVSPTRLMLTPGVTSAVLTLTNASTNPVRFQLSAFTWDQSEDGRMRLVDTTDIVFYPPLLTIEAGQSRRVRVGAVVPIAALEKTYRLFVEELPDHRGGAGPEAGIHVRTKMGVPIFLGAPRPTTRTIVENLELADGDMYFHVSNRGTAHVLLQKVQIRGLSASGEQVFARSVDGWYLLAGRHLRFRIPVPPAQCAQAATIAVVAESDRGPANARLALTRSNCGGQ